MALRNDVLFGLKVSFNFSDIESRTIALENLGLDIRDLAVVKGIGDAINQVDLQNISGLDVNLTRYLDRLKSDSGRYRGIVNDLSGYQFPTRGNFEAYGPVSGGAVRYKYIPNDQGEGLTQSDLKYGDISTSRVSSWSSATSDETDFEQAISYGASVQVKGTLKIGQNQNFTPGTGEAIINVLDTPEPIRFATEVPTDMIELDINGQTQFVYAMRGIPIIFTVAFKNLAMDFGFQPFGTLNPIYTIQATDLSEQEITSVPNVSSNTSRLRFNSQSFKERYVKVYYPPNNIVSIIGRSLNIRFFPKVKFINLQYVDLETNLLGEMPDWQTISYNDNNDSQLTTIRLQNNPLYLTEDEELQTFGTNTVKRLPKSLVNYYGSGTYFASTTFKTADEDVVIIKEVGVPANDTEAAGISSSLNRTSTQTKTISIIGTSVDITGIFYDYHSFDGKHYYYISEPEYSIDVTTIPNYRDEVKILDLSTRCPNLQVYYMRNSSGRYLYRNGNSYFIDSSNPFVKVTGQEYTPAVNIKKIKTYDIYDNYFTRLHPVFTNPDLYLGVDDDSDLESFIVGENEALTTDTGSINFSRMTAIRSINIYDTALPIPTGLQNRNSLVSVSCSYTRFPNRNSTAPVWDTLTGDGNPFDSNRPNGNSNHLFTNKNPASFGQYVFSGCGNLTTLSFYGSSLDGMIPKFQGNNSLTSIDFRSTGIEGGRPANLTGNQGLHGRTYIMWDDTFQDSQSITSIRIRSTVLGRNIGIYDPVTQTYDAASFQGSTFNLPSLTYLEITSSGGYITGNFFNVGVAPALQTLISNSTGWGTSSSLSNGTPLPTFAGNPNIRYIDLSDNFFSGTIQLNNLSSLSEFYLSSNNLGGIQTFSNLAALKYFIVGNNPNMTGALPNFSTGSPNVQYLGLNNCKFNSYPTGSFSGITRVRSIDLSNNLINQANIDQILLDCLANYNSAPRSGVIINLQGNAAPSKIVINIPTVTVSTAATETIVVNHPDPIQNFGPASSRVITLSAVPTATLTPNSYIKQSTTNAYGKIISVSGTSVTIDSTATSADTGGGPTGRFNTTQSYSIHLVSSPTAGLNVNNKLVTSVGSDVLVTNDPGIEQVVVSSTPQDPLYQFAFNINLRDGVDPNNSNIEYRTLVTLDGIDITSLVSINYVGDIVTFPGNTPGNVTNYPADGSSLKASVEQIVFGSRQEIEGGVVTAETLRKRGWIVRTE
jgi:hypothetical protein